MKRLLLILMTALPLYCAAQFEKSTLFVSGSGSFTSQKQTATAFSGQTASTKTSAVTISPKIGIFIIDKLLIGPILNVRFSTSKPPSTSLSSETKSTGIKVGPFVRYYVFRGLYVQGDYSWGTAKTKSTNLFSNSTATQKQTSNEFELGAGYTVFLNAGKNVALDISVAYRKTGNTIIPVNSFSSTDVDVSGLAINIGLSGFLHLKNSN